VGNGRYSRTILSPLLLGMLLSLALGSSSEVRAAYGGDLSISQYIHTAWSAAQGAPGSIWAMAQTPDGWLWLGAADGLYRFDGVRFERLPIEGRDPRQGRAITTLFAAESGGLWIGYDRGGLSLLKDGHFSHFGASEGLGPGTVLSLAEDASGTVWAAATGALYRFDGKRWQRVGMDWGYPDRYAQTAFLDQHGTLWVEGEEEIFALARDATHFSRSGLRFTAGDEPGIIQSPDGRTWYEDTAGIHPLPGQAGTSSRKPSVDSRESYVILIDDGGGLWWFGPHEVRHRANVADPMREILFKDSPPADIFTVKDGLSGPIMEAMLQDREGNIWVSTQGGIDRFRRPNLAKIPFEGGNAALAGGEAGSVWIGAHYGTRHADTDGLWKYDTALHRIALQGGEIDAAYRDSRGDLWVASSGGVWKSEDQEHFAKLPQLPEGARGEEVHMLLVDSAGAPWISVTRSHLFRLRDGVWEQNGNIRELPDDRPQSMTNDREGRLWLGYRNGTLAVVEKEKAKIISAQADIGSIFAINAAQHTVIASETQVAIFDDGHFHPLVASDPHALEGVNGIIETKGGDLWLNGMRGAVRIAARDLEEALKRKDYRIGYELFDAGDGFPGMAQRIRPVPTLIQGTDGRLWFAGTLGVAWIDPERILRNELPPAVAILSVTTANRQYSSEGSLLLPKGTRSLQIDYTALTLKRPELTRFRYRLDGVDSAWVEAGTRRQALYTNLGPGQYHFRVAAANESGVWNETDSSLDLSVPPTFVQTRGFAVLCGLVGLAFLWCAYLVRARQIAARERGRLAVRVAERERIAREIHDTLLQSVQGLTLQFHAAAKQLPPGSPARGLVEAALSSADRVQEEGRERVASLRSPLGYDHDLAAAIEDMGNTFAKSSSASFRLEVLGKIWPLRPIVEQEALRIVSEALLNAFRHGMASTVHVELRYEPNELVLRVIDNGRGIGPDILEEGHRPGHFGLAGMRERARAIRAGLNIHSLPDMGTEVELRVPAVVAHRRDRGLFGWIRSLWRCEARTSISSG
jgi:signal transduction histidine kinase/ligand-binding sensor domain-containing protein